MSSVHHAILQREQHFWPELMSLRPSQGEAKVGTSINNTDDRSYKVCLLALKPSMIRDPCFDKASKARGGGGGGGGEGGSSPQLSRDR